MNDGVTRSITDRSRPHGLNAQNQAICGGSIPVNPMPKWSNGDDDTILRGGEEGSSLSWWDGGVEKHWV